MLVFGARALSRRALEAEKPPSEIRMNEVAFDPAGLRATEMEETGDPVAGVKKRASKVHAKLTTPKDSGPKVTHQPQQPATGQSVFITADFRNHPSAEALELEYQIVDPGRYIALADSAYEKQWRKLPMNDKGQSGDQVGDDHIWTAQVPAELQKHRRLMRYRIRSVGSRKLVAPGEDDPQKNFAYFVYDGVPPWKGAINPGASEAKLSRPVVFSSEVLQRVPVYHLISSKTSVEKATWKAEWQGDRHAYAYTGTMVYDGVVYDHIGFRARGGSWRHAMGKNMWKFNFLPGHRFEARDNYGNRYRTKWDKLNLGACIQQADYGMRGEQGMFEAVGFRLFELAGLEASATHWVHFRIIDQDAESPADQYQGDFWGLYLAVENLDEHFLKEHRLPAGNLYKMEFGAKVAFNGDPNVVNGSDVAEFQKASGRRQLPDSWWTENLDLPRYYNYRAILECIHHYDIDSGKNYFYYRNPESRKWVVLPWDIDLSWGDHMFGGGHEPFYRAGILSRPQFRQEYQQRLAELRDLLFNPEQVGRLIDEYAGIISEPGGAPSLVDADRAKWDYHPVMASAYVMAEKSGQGRFYFGDPHNTFGAMVQYMKRFAAERAKWVDRQLLRGYAPPASPTVRGPESLPPGLEMIGVQSTPPSNVTPKAYQWRLADVTPPGTPGTNRRQPWHYEIQAVWETETPEGAASIPGKLLVPGHEYRVRSRLQESGGTWSRWSSPAVIKPPPK